MSDFINDEDLDDESSENDVKKKYDVLNQTKQRHGNSKGNTFAVSKKKLMKKAKQLLSSSESSSSDVPLSKFAKKYVLSDDCESESTMKLKRHDSENSDDNDFFSRTLSHKKLNRKRKRSTVIKSSNSDSDGAPKSFINNKSEGSDSNSENRENTSLATRPCSNRLRKMTRQKQEKHDNLFSTLIQKRKKTHKSNETKDSLNLICASSGSGEENRKETWENSSEMDSNESDRDFVVGDGEDEGSDTGMNSERESELLELLNLYSRKFAPERENCTSLASPSNNYYNSTVKQRKNKKKRKWLRVVKRGSEEGSDDSEEEGLDDHELPLHASVMKGKIEEVIECLKRDSECIFNVGPKNKTALHLASILGNSEIVKILLDAGSDIYSCDSSHLTPTAYAADGHPECLELMLDHISVKDANKSIRQNDIQMSLLHFAVGHSRDGSQAFDRAKCLQLIYKRDKKTTYKLLNHQDCHGFTPLVAAVYTGQHEVCTEGKGAKIIKKNISKKYIKRYLITSLVMTNSII